MPYQKKSDKGKNGSTRDEYYVNIPTRHGGRVQRSAKTKKEKVATNYESMLQILGPEKRQFDLIELVLDGKVTLAELYRAHVDGTTKELRDRFAKKIVVAPPPPPPVVDLDPLVDEWREARRNHVAKSTLDNYVGMVRTLIPAKKPFPVELLTTTAISKWLAESEGEAATFHYRLAAVRRFIRYLKEIKVIVENPAAGIERPRLPYARTNHLSSVQAVRLAEAQPPVFREFSALLNGTGADVSLALVMRVRDVDRKNREIRFAGAHGVRRKTESRDRIVRVADWAWPYVERLLAGRGQDDLVFDPSVINRFEQWRQHRAAVQQLIAEGYDIYEGYTPRDSRHTFAVRLVRAGTPPEVVARQLGHKDATMVHRVYGRFVPRQDERAFWERRAQEWEEQLEVAG